MTEALSRARARVRAKISCACRHTHKKKKQHFMAAILLESVSIGRKAYCVTAHVAPYTLPAMKSQYPTQFHWTLDVLNPTPIGTTNAV